MGNPHVGEDLLAYLSGNLDEASSQNVKSHLAICDTCRRKLDSFNLIWNRLGQSPEEHPDESLSTRVYDMLREYEQESRRSTKAPVRMHGGRVWNRFLTGRPAFQIGLAVALLAAGFMSGYGIKGSTTGGPGMAQLQEEVRGLSRLLTVSLLQQQSASERLKGVSWSSRLNGPDPEIREALMNALKYDPNVNVRLAALDALSRDMSRPDVRREIIRALPEQPSPLMQIALVDLLVQINDKESRNVLQQVMSKPHLNQDVRKRIQQGIQQTL